MTGLESMIRLSRPESLEPGPHRGHLALRLMERRDDSRLESWSFPRHVLALTVGLLCFGMAIALQPKTPEMRLWAEQRALLSELIAADRALPFDPVTASLTARPRPPARDGQDENSAKIFRDNREALNDILAEWAGNQEKQRGR